MKIAIFQKDIGYTAVITEIILWETKGCRHFLINDILFYDSW